ncbi:glycerophosphodiester phosphodiesterase family protein [Frigidibacter sp. SD6-1]|uniref:glycerophosphodiester phosphodiesterase family protein n=1 Tax=Frigidibacter sp. SD6-1 TaxID=3032581 RepID=UPI0024DFD9E7|nr:glycerophosphodiester phosphodiesterase family protein [Frigidibacter sp. SD6-1]
MSTFDPRQLHERFRDPNGTPGEVFVTAHRGDFLSCGKVVTAENSVRAVERARDLGVDMVEVDVHRIADGSLVVIHDRTLERTTDATGEVAALTRSDLRAIELVHPTTRAPLGCHIPSLEAVFAALGPQMMINVELKSGVELLTDVATLAERCGVSAQVTVKTNLRDGTDFTTIRKMIDACTAPVDVIPVIIDSADGFEGFERAVRILRPNCVECVVDYEFGADDGYSLLARRGMTLDGGVLFSPRARRLAVEHNVRLFVNTLYVNPVTNGNHQWNGGRSCELGRVVPDAVYGFWIAHGATVIQTDEAPFVLAWLRAAGFHS